jgi:hypothetical protein
VPPYHNASGKPSPRRVARNLPLSAQVSGIGLCPMGPPASLGLVMVRWLEVQHTILERPYRKIQGMSRPEPCPLRSRIGYGGKDSHSVPWESAQ